MFSARTFATPVARAAFKPQVASRAFATAQILRAPALTEAITSDHRKIEDAYKQVVNSDDIDHQTRYGNLFIWELARHSVAEELIVYPAMEKYMGEAGKDHAEKDREQHHQVSQTLHHYWLEVY